MVDVKGVKTTLKVGMAKYIFLNISEIIEDVVFEYIDEIMCSLTKNLTVYTVLQRNLLFKKIYQKNRIFDKFFQVNVNKFS